VSAEGTVRKRRQERQWVELVTAALLSLGGAATTICSYEASIWGGRQAASFSRATLLRTDAAQIAERAGQLALVDVSSFVAWLQASQGGQPHLAEVFRARLRPEFRPLFEAWLAQEPFKNPAAAATPFTQFSYHVAKEDEAQALSQLADEVFEEGQYANAQTDYYLRGSVIFAMTLFFAGVGHQFRRFVVQVGMLALAGAMFAFGVYKLVQLPRVGPAEHARPRPAQPVSEVGPEARP
jgi:hypothetical protein